MILFVAEHQDGALRPVSRELVAMTLGMGRELGMPVVGLVLGSGAGEAGAVLSELQVDRVIVAEDPVLEGGAPELLASAVGQVIDRESPTFVIGGHTSEGIEFIPRLAVRRDRSLVAACVGYERHGDRVLLTRGIFNSRLRMRVLPRGPSPWFLTLSPGSFPADELETGPGVEPESLTLDLSGVEVRRRSRGREHAARGAVQLEAADVIVAVGRGIQKEENLPVVQELADALGAPLGASRPVVDAGWLPRDRQIGSSGQTVSPRLYLAIGISGAIQHLVGMQSSRCIVAINKDPDAPVFKVAHYGIAGDLFEVVPELTRMVRELKAPAARAD